MTDDVIAREFQARCGPDVRYVRHRMTFGRLIVVFWIGARRYGTSVGVANGTLAAQRRAARAAAAQAASDAYIVTGKLQQELAIIMEAGRFN